MTGTQRSESGVEPEGGAAEKPRHPSRAALTRTAVQRRIHIFMCVLLETAQEFRRHRYGKAAVEDDSDAHAAVDGDRRPHLPRAFGQDGGEFVGGGADGGEAGGGELV